MSADFSGVKAKIKSMGIIGIAALLFHPLIVPFYTVVSWVTSLWTSRILLLGRWSRYHGFHAQNAVNSMFYRTQWINIDRYGRMGKSPELGLGNFSLSGWWHLSSLASYFYSYAGAVTTLVGTLFLVFSQLIWVEVVNWQWVLTVIAVTFFSSTAIMTAFHSQNYQILSWMFLPVVLYAIANNNILMAGIAFFAAGIFGLTFLFISVPLVFGQAFITGNHLMILLLLPPFLIKLINFIPVLKTTGINESISTIGKLVGFVHTNVNYKRTSMKIGLHHIYFLVLYSIAPLLIWFVSKEAPILLLIAYCMFLGNQLFIRIADDQSVILVYFVITAFEVISREPNLFSLLALLITANPRPAYLVTGKGNKVKHYTPFDIEPILKEMRKFLAVPENTNVLFAFNDPQNQYEKIFDGYRIIIEAPLLAATEKKIHLFPDWWAVAETNYVGAPKIWGRDIETVKANLNLWNTNYVVIYQDCKTTLEDKWNGSFEIISSVDWSELCPDFVESEFIKPTLLPPKWWLLKKVNVNIY